ncbi:MAG: hypothetical protein HYW49_02850 [Deltaproteobacteria bacterium]|nr:hypothetical protein [Deltaproteobacteria bacterium]
MSSKPRFERPVASPAVLALLGAAFATAGAQASPCCAGSGGQSICVLPSEQRYQLGLATSYREVQGHFDPYGEYSANPKGVSSRSVTTVVGAAYRVREDLQAGLSVPTVSSYQSLPGKSLSATGLGDPALEGRYTLLEDLSFLKYQPQLSFYGGLRFPLGKSVYDSTDPYGANVFGDGAYTAHAGLNASKIYYPLKPALDAAYFHPFPRTVDRMRGAAVATPYSFQNGDRLQLLESATLLLGDHFSGTAGLKQLWIFQSRRNGNAVDGSAGRLFSTLASLNYFHDASWSFGLSHETAFPFYQYEASQADARVFSMSVVYGGF